MKVLSEWIRTILRWCGLIIFQVLIFFWIIKFVYCVRGYFAAGSKGMLSALVHGSPLSPDSADWGHPLLGLQIARLVGIAFITLTLGILNRGALRTFWHDIRDGSSKGTNLRISRRGDK
jgi:hypothetical protein